MRALILCLSLAAAVFCPALPAPAAEQSAEARALASELARRGAILAEAVQNAYVPPPAGLMPHPEEIPLAGAWEDPDWDSPLMLNIYKNPYSYSNNLDNFLPCLEEALRGNPKAMLALSMYYFLWGYVIEDNYPDFPPQVHSVHFWRAWAERMTNPGWVRLRLGDLHGRWPASSLEYYRQAAELGNAEAMYNYYKVTGKRRDYLFRSAALGYAKAAFLLGEELEKQGGADNIELARRYTWLAAMNADEWGLLHSSFSFYNGDFKAESSCEQGYLYAVLSVRLQYGSAASTHQPDNICMLAPDVLGRLEATADRWQADHDQRRLPHIVRSRYRRAPALEALQTELADFMDARGIARNIPGGDFDRSQAAGTRKPGEQDFSWHFGFFSENTGPTSLGEAGGEQYRARGSRNIPWIYAFVILSMVSGAGFIMYGQRLKKQRQARTKGQNEDK